MFGETRRVAIRLVEVALVADELGLVDRVVDFLDDGVDTGELRSVSDVEIHLAERRVGGGDTEVAKEVGRDLLAHERIVVVIAAQVELFEPEEPLVIELWIVVRPLVEVRFERVLTASAVSEV